MRRWLSRLAIVAWLCLGFFAAWLSPEGEPPGPVIATRIYGEARSMMSSAPGGTLALARVLGRFGFAVGANTRVGAPASDVLFLLAPSGPLAEAEIDALLTWVKAGGHLVYAPAPISFVAKPDEDDDAQEEQEDAAPPVAFTANDPLSDAIGARGQLEEAIVGAPLVYHLERGLVFVLPDRGAALTNDSLKQHGLAAELPWLSRALEGAHVVHFDEARLGFGEQEGLMSLLGRSRFADALRLGALALVIYFVARGVRRLPAHPPPPGVGRDFGEHLFAVADVLAVTRRLALANGALRAGTIRRLGPLAHLPRARAVLEPMGAPPRNDVELARRAQALHALERALLSPTDLTGRGAGGDNESPRKAPRSA